MTHRIAHVCRVAALRADGGYPAFAENGGPACAVLEDAGARAGQAPRYIVSDRGAQFQDEYRVWCRQRGVRPRFGAVGQHGSIAIIERFILSMKEEFLRRIHVPATHSAMVAALGAYELWYNVHRPHDTRWPDAGPDARRIARPRDRERIEPRPRLPLTALSARRPRGELELVVGYVAGRRELPTVELREAA